MMIPTEELTIGFGSHSHLVMWRQEPRQDFSFDVTLWWTVLLSTTSSVGA